MPYAGQDFAPTQPGTKRTYTLGFVNDIAIRPSQNATIGGSATSGDSIQLTFLSSGLADCSVQIIYTVKTGDTLTSIAVAIAALINGTDELTDAAISASPSGAVVNISYPGTLPLDLEALVFNDGSIATTETVEFSAGAFSGETIISATWVCEVFLGGSDLTPSSRLFGSATINGANVSVLAGEFVAQNTYRLTCTATTSGGQICVLYSHVACSLPQ